MQVYNWTWNNNTFTPEDEDDSDIALLANGYPYIAVPEPLYIDMWAEFMVNDWTCGTTAVNPQDDYCYTDSNCRNWVSTFPTFTITFVESAEYYPHITFKIDILPEMYLVESGEDMCVAALRQINDDDVAGFILGSPFFRNITVNFGYSEAIIEILSKDVDSPISPVNHYPDYNETAYFQAELEWLPTGQYYGAGYAGTSLQGFGELFAYSTGSYYTVIPSNSSDSSVSDGWFDKDASSTYNDTGVQTGITVGYWGGVCEISDDSFCFEFDAECVEALEFCLLTSEPIHSSYNFSAIAGFGKPDGTYEQLMDSLVGQYWDQASYKPVVTFDFNFESGYSNVTVGSYQAIEDDFYFASNSSSLSNYWALDVDMASYGSNQFSTFPIASAIIDSEYPYIAMPTDMWTAVKSDLTSAGFVCFPSPFKQLAHCVISRSCSDIASQLEDVQIFFQSNIDSGCYSVTLDPSVYLLQSSDTQCTALLSESIEENEGFILGTPFFRQEIVQLDFKNLTVSLYSKTVSSPINLGARSSQNGYSISETQIGGIAFGVLGLLAVCWYS